MSISRKNEESVPTSINSSLKALAVCTIITALEIFKMSYPEYQVIFVLFTLLLSCSIVVYFFSRTSNKYNELEQNLLMLKERNDQIVAHIREDMFSDILIVDVTNNIPYGEGVQRLIGSTGVPGERMDYEKLISLCSQQYVYQEDAAMYGEKLSRKYINQMFAEGFDSIDFDYRRKVDNNKYRWYSAHVCLYRSKINQSLNAIVFVMDIDDDKKELERAQHKSSHDLLTNMLNKISTEEAINKAMTKLEINETYAFIMLDMDNFKRVNDTLGHSMGDNVLKTAASFMRQSFRENDILGRIGGDEFVILVQNIEKEVLRTKLEAMNWRVKTMSILKDCDWNTSLSIGVIMGEKPSDFQTLYKQADTFLYEAKKKGKGRVIFADEA